LKILYILKENLIKITFEFLIFHYAAAVLLPSKYFEPCKI